MSDREIRVCSEKESTGGSEITICPAQDDAIPKEIRICPGDCNNPPELTLTGEDAPSVGDIYSASGGEGVYRFSFNGGTIDRSTGEILSVTSCGGPENNGAIGSVTVIDSCGQSASIEVRLPGGYWVREYYHIISSGAIDGTSESISGGVKYVWGLSVSTPNPAAFSDCSHQIDGTPDDRYSSGCQYGPITDGCSTYCGVACNDPVEGGGFYCLTLKYEEKLNWTCI